VSTLSQLDFVCGVLSCITSYEKLFRDDVVLTIVLLMFYCYIGVLLLYWCSIVVNSL